MASVTQWIPVSSARERERVDAPLDARSHPGELSARPFESKRCRPSAVRDQLTTRFLPKRLAFPRRLRNSWNESPPRRSRSDPRDSPPRPVPCQGRARTRREQASTPGRGPVRSPGLVEDAFAGNRSCRKRRRRSRFHIAETDPIANRASRAVVLRCLRESRFACVRTFWTPTRITAGLGGVSHPLERIARHRG